MRFSLAVFLTSLLLSVGLQSAPARADAYQTFLRQLEEKVEDLSSGGWMSRDIRELKRAVRLRPQGKYPRAYRSFVRLLLKSVRRLRSGGFMSREREVIEILLKANPDPHREALDPADHQLFVKSFAAMARDLHSGGYMSAEREVLRNVSRAAPRRKHPPRIYARTYPHWSRALADLEKLLRSGGLMASEREVIAMFEGLRPQRVEDQPVVTPAPPEPSPGDWDYDYDEYAVTDPGVVRACGRTYRVSWEGKRPRRYRNKANRLLLLKRTTELIELDEDACRERWVTDHARRVVPVRGTEAFVVLREGGLAFLVDERGDVYRLKRNIADCQAGRRHQVTLIHRRGRRIDLKIEGAPETGGLPVSINGRPRMAVRLYRASWRSLR